MTTTMQEIMTTDWTASNATGSKVHLMSRELSERYKSGRISVERLRTRCGQQTRRTYITPCKPVREVDLATLPLCEKCIGRSMDARTIDSAHADKNPRF